MGAAAMLLGTGKMRDFTCLALIRPVYSGGSWVPGDASPWARTITNSGLTIGAEGTGPWGGTSRAILDPSGVDGCYIGTTVYQSAKMLDLWVRPPSVPPAVQIYARIASGTGDKPTVYLYWRAGGPGKIRLGVSCFPTTGATEYAYTDPTDRDYGVDYHVTIALPETTPGPIKLAVSGSWRGQTASVTPDLSGTVYFVLGRFTVTTSPYNATGQSMAEARLSSVYRWTPGVDFTPPTGPYEV